MNFLNPINALWIHGNLEDARTEQCSTVWGTLILTKRRFHREKLFLLGSHRWNFHQLPSLRKIHLKWKSKWSEGKWSEMSHVSQFVRNRGSSMTSVHSTIFFQSFLYGYVRSILGVRTSASVFLFHLFSSLPAWVVTNKMLYLSTIPSMDGRVKETYGATPQATATIP